MAFGCAADCICQHCCNKFVTCQETLTRVQPTPWGAMQGSRQAKSPTQPAEYTQTHVFHSTPARPRLRRRSLSDIKHTSSCEIQLQTAQSCTGRSSCSQTGSAEAAGSQPAAPGPSSRASLDSDAYSADHGIELQVQGHAEMLEHALGTPVHPHRNNVC